MNVADIAARDGWSCWICDNDIDPDARAGTHHAASVDHVIPKKYGGDTIAENLRLAHRRCNSRRGSALPELRWPPGMVPVDSADLWQSLRRLLKQPAGSETVALFLHATDADRASGWMVAAATTVTGVTWECEVEERASLFGLSLRRGATPHDANGR